MMQHWSESTVGFMRDAADYGDYFERIAEFLLPDLPTDGHVCDAGCGIGRLALELSKHCRHVTAVDASQIPINELLRKPLPDNLSVYCEDIFQMRAQYDAMVFCFFGRAHEILRIASAQCTGKVFVLKRNCSEHRFSLKPVTREKDGWDETASVLCEMGIAFERRDFSPEFGQPFRSIDEAVRFFKLYDRTGGTIDAVQLADRLVETGRDDFPLYLPMRRRMEVFSFSAKDIPLFEAAVVGDAAKERSRNVD